MPVLPFKEQSPILGENVYIAPGADGMYRRYINLARVNSQSKFYSGKRVAITLKNQRI